MNSHREKNIFLLSLFFIIFIFSSSAFASVAGDVNHANSLYKHGKFDDALKLYQEALQQNGQSPVVKYDLGTALYKKGDYAKAFGYLEQAARDKNSKIKPLAEYNLGNDLYRAGVQKEGADVNGAIETLQQALGQYGQALGQNPKDQDALFNEGVVRKEIERLKKLPPQKAGGQAKQQQQRKNQKQQQNQQHQQNQQSRQNQEKNRKQNRQQNQHSRQGRQKSQKQPEQQQSSGSKGQNQQKPQSQAAESQQELDRQQAERALEDYRQNEEPRRLLNYMSQKIDTRPVLKDW
ncbi:MAG: tetratricopeptide repeat protein [Candidatus Omnitrophica bacterium]|nr:tetratricopeptide repeat protein [Candidatus Omnitrophota bacterium]MDE2008896.1 tetratricopeptide repeat protein [Candidatus Omnitrophota bacterium]MDE2213541.1 tetratricopeptide repeat protein [Candidatus Omnitrophota bacterium]MDE2230558.1 tetratricopeptide repeat protein [Candidatus Omnitrophota bacterium]